MSQMWSAFNAQFIFFYQMDKPVYFVYKVQKHFATLGICLEKYEILKWIFYNSIHHIKVVRYWTIIQSSVKLLFLNISSSETTIEFIFYILDSQK